MVSGTPVERSWEKWHLCPSLQAPLRKYLPGLKERSPCFLREKRTHTLKDAMLLLLRALKSPSTLVCLEEYLKHSSCKAILSGIKYSRINLLSCAERHSKCLPNWHFWRRLAKDMWKKCTQAPVSFKHLVLRHCVPLSPRSLLWQRYRF